MIFSSALRSAALAAAVVTLPSLAFGFQSTDTSFRGGDSTLHAAHLRVDTTLALIPVHVATPGGTPVTDLSRENFRVLEDDVEQKIRYFGTEDAPVSVGLLFDTSGSMRTKMHQATKAAEAFFQTSTTGDEFFLVEFNDKPKLALGFTPDSQEVSRQIFHTKPVGRTSLLDAIHLGLVQMKHARNPRKALVILSDGGDNHSRRTTNEIRRDVKESEVEIYAMGIFDPEEFNKLPAEERNGPHLLDELAQATGGIHFPVEHLGDLSGIASKIGNQLRSEYVIGYEPSSITHDGKYHRVTVDLQPPPDKPNLQVFYRRGYHESVD